MTAQFGELANIANTYIWQLESIHLMELTSYFRNLALGVVLRGLNDWFFNVHQDIEKIKFSIKFVKKRFSTR